MDARYYSSVTKRFRSLDPIAQYAPEQVLADPQQLNSYSYVANNPLRYNDPTGLFKVESGLIEEGDTLSEITEELNNHWKTNYSTRQIADLNDIEDQHKIREGDYLIPNDLNPDITTQFKLMLHTNAADPAIHSPIGTYRFYERVKPGGPWDFKNQDGLLNSRTHDSFIFEGEQVRTDFPGNFNYGYTGASTWWGNEEFLLNMAGAAQTYSNVRNGRSPEWNSPYWDNPGDINQIKQGIEYYEMGY